MELLKNKYLSLADVAYFVDWLVLWFQCWSPAKLNAMETILKSESLGQEGSTPKSKIGIFKSIQGLITLSWLYVPRQDGIAEKIHILCQRLDLEYPSLEL